MSDRDMPALVRRRVLATAAAVGIVLTLAAGGARAGILRNVLASIGLTQRAPDPKSGSGLPRQGYACCVLHYDGDWISDGNYASLPMIPIGTPVEVLSYGRNRAYVKVDGKPMRLGHDLGRDQESLDDWVKKLVVADDPRPRLGAYPRTVQAAIREGKLVVGMTRDQIIAAVGYPTTNENFSLTTPVWRMRRSEREEYELHLGGDGRLESVTGDSGVVSDVTYHPGK
jgi:hypothetical protein